MQRKYRKSYLNVRLDEKTTKEIRRLAALQRRSVSNLIALWTFRGLEAERAQLAKLGKADE